MAKNKFRWILTGIIIGCVVLAAVAGIGSWPPPTPSTETVTGNRVQMRSLPVELVPVKQDSIAAELELTGNFLPQRRTLIVAEVDGVIQSFPETDHIIEAEVEGRKYHHQLGLNLGHFVKQGDVLVTLDPTEYQLQLDVAKARLKHAESQLEDLLAWHRPERVRQIEASKEEAGALLERAEAEFERVKSLAGQRASSQQELDHAQAELRSTRAIISRTQAELEEALAGPTETEIEIMRALVQQAASEVAIHQDRLNRTVIYAPYSGVITEKFVYEGERVTMMPRVELMELIDVEILMVEVSVPERYSRRIQRGDWVNVQVVGQQATVPGMVILVNEKIDYQTRTFRVRIGVENYDYRFKAGQFAKVAFRLDWQDDTMVVPTDAVLYSGGQPHVFVYDPKTQQVQQRSIRSGILGTGSMQVLDGLEIGEWIVLHDPAILASGMRVDPTNFSAAEFASQSTATTTASQNTSAAIQVSLPDRTAENATEGDDR